MMGGGRNLYCLVIVLAHISPQRWNISPHIPAVVDSHPNAKPYQLPMVSQNPDRLMRYPGAPDLAISESVVSEDYVEYECVIHPFPQKYDQSMLDIGPTPQRRTREWAFRQAQTHGKGVTWQSGFGDPHIGDAVSHTVTHSQNTGPRRFR